MKLAYSFDSRLNIYPDNDWILDIYAAAMTKAKQFGHKVLFYGDSYSINKLKGFYDASEDISDKEFILVDDLKLYIHEVNDLDCVTIDGDIILHDTLILPKGSDVVFELAETRSNVLKKKYNPQHGYFDLVEIFNPYMIYSDHWNDKLELSCNVGMIKFNSQGVKTLFLSEYKKFREHFLSKIEPHEKLLRSKYVPSIIVAQYNFGLLSSHYNVNVKYFKDYNTYTHFYGKIKFAEKTKKAVYSILNKKQLV